MRLPSRTLYTLPDYITFVDDGYYLVHINTMLWISA